MKKEAFCKVYDAAWDAWREAEKALNDAVKARDEKWKALNKVAESRNKK